MCCTSRQPGCAVGYLSISCATTPIVVTASVGLPAIALGLLAGERILLFVAVADVVTAIVSMRGGVVNSWNDAAFVDMFEAGVSATRTAGLSGVASMPGVHGITG